ncbi:uncharacterized protein TNCV_4211661 [Trichonephila clavipes]|nr:uncharacterized protein TNCV_4211661 [Trichonephila clavipes]
MSESCSLPISLNCFLDLLVLPVYHQSKTCDPCFQNDCPGIHYPLLHQINFWQHVEATWTAVPQGYIQNIFDYMSRSVSEAIDNNGSYTNY